jgi:hypothetical protein
MSSTSRQGVTTDFVTVLLPSSGFEGHLLEGRVLKNAKHCSGYRDSQSEFTISMKSISQDGEEEMNTYLL